MNHTHLKTIKNDLRVKHKTIMRAAPLHQIQTHSQLTTQNIINHSLYKSAQTLCLFLSLPHEYQTSSLLKHALDHDKKVFVPRVTGPHTMEMFRIYSYEDYDTLPLSSWNIPEPEQYVQRAVVPEKDQHQLKPYLSSPAHSERNQESDLDTHVIVSAEESKTTSLQQQESTSPQSDSIQDTSDLSLLQRENIKELSHILSLSLVICPCVAFDADKNRLGYGGGFYDRYLDAIFTIRKEHGKEPVPLLLAALPSQFEDSTIPTNEHDFKMSVVIAGDRIIE